MIEKECPACLLPRLGEDYVSLHGQACQGTSVQRDPGQRCRASITVQFSTSIRTHSEQIVEGKNLQILVSRVIPKSSPKEGIFALDPLRRGSKENILCGMATATGVALFKKLGLF